MAKKEYITGDEISLLIAIVAKLEPNNYPNSDLIKALIYRCRNLLKTVEDGTDVDLKLVK